jgi:hypothetical protein
VVPHNILLPVDLSAKGFRLEDYVKTFSHLPSKHFSAFFITDYVRIRSDAVKTDRGDTQKKTELLARKLGVDLKFIACPGSLPSLWYQSRFADLLTLNLQDAHMLNTLYAEKFFDDFACPILLQEGLPEEQEEIIFLFDHDPTSLGSLKSFLALFGGISKEKKLTVISLNAHEGPGIYFEKSLIEYLQQIFDNVGLLPMAKNDIAKNVLSFASRARKPLVIMGKSGRLLFEDETTAQTLAMGEISLYYANH